MSKEVKEVKVVNNLSVITNAIEKEFGPVVKWLGEASSFISETLPTGSLGLDLAIGNGGLERGLVAEFFGGPGAGKSFLAYSVIKEACRRGHKSFIVDAEHALDPRLLIKMGFPENDVLIVDGAPTGEANLDIAHRLMETGQFAVGVIDSVAALVPNARVEQDYGQQTMGLHARLMSAGLQKISTVVKKTNTLLIFINQLRHKIGEYGNPETTTGGNALPFYASYRISLRGGVSKSSRLIDEGTGEVYGHRTLFEVVKNKRAAPYRKAEVDLIYGVGYDTAGELVDLAVDTGLFDKGGAWITYGEYKWQGRDKSKLAIMADEGLRQEVANKLRGIASPVLAVGEKSASKKRLAEKKEVSA